MVIRLLAWTTVRVVLTLATAILVALSDGLFLSRTSAEPEPSLWQLADREDLCVTNGAITRLPPPHMAIETPSARAVLRTQTAPAAELRFRYLGPSESTKPLASGELRRQVGLKLLAQDTCNVLYAMWHIEPDTRVSVSLKRNADKHTHAQCGAGGYVTLTPHTSVTLPKILPNEWHTFRADLRGPVLTLMADGRVVWEGQVVEGLNDLKGPIGLRTDNVRVEFELYAGRHDGPREPADLTWYSCGGSAGE